MGSLVFEEQLQRVSGYLEFGRVEGATAVVGGGRFGDQGFFIEPSVLINIHGQMKVCARRSSAWCGVRCSAIWMRCG